MVKKIVLATAVSSLLFGAGIAQAEVAKVVSVGGKAVVERGSHKYDATSGMFLEEGDVVRSLQGKVQLKFSNCVSYVDTNKEVTVSKSNPCATATVASSSTGIASAASSVSAVPVLAGLAGVAAVASGSGSSTVPSAKVTAVANGAVSP